MFVDQSLPWVRNCSTIIEQHTEEPMYDDDDEFQPVMPVKKKKPKYRPGERLLRSIAKKNKSKKLDMSVIHSSISEIIDDLAEL